MSKNKFIAAIILLFGSVTLTAQNMLNYTIEITKPETHYAKVKISTKAEGDQLHFVMPSWTPGSYLMREFAKSVDRVKASINGIEIPVTKTDKGTWEVTGVKGKKVDFEYDVYAFELSVRTSFIDDQQAFLHNTSIFMLVEEQKNEPGTISIVKPENWQVISTSLKKDAYKFLFSDYDDLGDSPIQIGNHEVFNFDVRGVPHEVAMVGVNNADIKKLKVDMQRICEIMTDIIDVHPCEKYVFFVQNVESGGGGLEHKNSCTVMMPRWSYTNSSKYNSFLGLIAHEYFHLWNVKRIRPAALGPFDYKNENYTNLLWVAEGITSYYDELAMYTFGYRDKNAYLSQLASYVTRVENTPGTYVQTLSESSWDAWIKSYRPNENSNNTGISYYSKGLVVAMLLDAEIIGATLGKKNLNDLMQYLYKEYAVKLNRGFTDEEFKQAVNKVVGKNLEAFLDKYVYGLEMPAYAEIMSKVNVVVSLENRLNQTIGLRTKLENGRTIISSINSKSCAYSAGLNVNDEIIAINEIRVSNDIDEVVSTLSQKNNIKLLINRSGLIKTANLEFAPIQEVNVSMKTGNPSKTQISFFRD
jgi:predicted metalloprotease with PDZ domain